MNIYSRSTEGNGLAAALTNPTELSFYRGTVKNHYPVQFNNRTWTDAEAAYQALKQKGGPGNSNNLWLMVNLLEAKLTQYPRLFNTVKKLGGVDFLETCIHSVNGGMTGWCGRGRKSPFLLCLIAAYELVEQTRDGEELAATRAQFEINDFLNSWRTSAGENHQ